MKVAKLAYIAVFGLAGLEGRAGTFFDGFDSGLDSSHWYVWEAPSGSFTSNFSEGKVQFSKPFTSGFAFRGIGAGLHMSSVGGPISGDFGVEIDVDNVSVGAFNDGQNQVELRTFFTDGLFCNSFSNEINPRGLHVWDGSWHYGFSTQATSGTFRIQREGSILSAYFSDSLVWSKSSTSALTGIDFVAQNNWGTSAMNARFDNFRLTAPSVVPEPTTAAALTVSLVAFGARAWRRRETKAKAIGRTIPRS